MNYLFILKSNDPSQLAYLKNVVQEHPTSIVLMQEATYLVNTIFRVCL